MSEPNYNLYCFDGGLDYERTDPHKIKLNVDPTDRRAFDALPKSDHVGVRVIDLNTGDRWHVRRAACNLDCFCAAVAWRCQDGNGHHGPKPLDEDTWAIVTANWQDGLPARSTFATGKYAQHRILLIAQTNFESHYAGAFFDVNQLTQDWGDTEGFPHCAVDLSQPPERAFISLRISLAQQGDAEDLREYYTD